ncbi:hypothetical protein EDB81DRAFT_468901 [Dactylonectria macrodidyma]|uniref:Transmembrane protein n=1 Tax=Dactylonectria macrodidyma TaxID=307937 RepID=A0A9P9J7S3_9HYPO|nr:hypothetical protein EDB81DRAFT_468901 [Dactylonectria macrodidyma]
MKLPGFFPGWNSFPSLPFPPWVPVSQPQHPGPIPRFARPNHGSEKNTLASFSLLSLLSFFLHSLPALLCATFRFSVAYVPGLWRWVSRCFIALISVSGFFFFRLPLEKICGERGMCILRRSSTYVKEPLFSFPFVITVHFPHGNHQFLIHVFRMPSPSQPVFGP